MLNSIRGLLFGAAVDGYSGAEGDSIASTLRTTAADDEWLLVDDGDEPPKDLSQSSKCNPEKVKQSGSQPLPSSASDRVGDVFAIDVEDGWSIMPPAIFDVDTPSPPIVADPLENLFIEHASMSVYGSLRQRTGAHTPAEPIETTQDVVANHPAPNNNRVSVANRTECYNLRKMSMQKARSSKKQMNRKAFDRLNQTTHYPKHVGHSVSRSVVFQPRK